MSESFSKLFPSLKGKDASPLKYRIPFKDHKGAKVLSKPSLDFIGMEYVEVEVYPENIIQKHCIDKQRASKLLDELEAEYEKYGAPEPVEPCMFLIDVKRKLGLGE